MEGGAKEPGTKRMVGFVGVDMVGVWWLCSGGMCVLMMVLGMCLPRGYRDLIYSAPLLLCCFVTPERFVLKCLESGGVVACVMSSSVNGLPRSLFDASDTPKPSHADASKPRPGRR